MGLLILVAFRPAAISGCITDVAVGFRHFLKNGDYNILFVGFGTPAVLHIQQLAHIVQMPIVAKNLPLAADAADIPHQESLHDARLP